MKILPLMVVTAFAACAPKSAPPPQTEQHIDVPRFMGMWYEIARLPYAPQRDCAAFASRYEQINDEEFGIVNYCWHKSANGPMRKTRAAAFLDIAESAAKLKVQLKWPVWNDLWILYISEGYEHALLGTPDRKHLWLLSRTPSINVESRTRLLEWAESEGFDTAEMFYDEATAVAPPETDTPSTPEATVK